MNDDFVCIGFDTAGFICHVTTGEKWLCQSTADSIRRIYKSVRVVDYVKFLELMEKDKLERSRQKFMSMERAVTA